jgi:hypothetical protein
VKRIIALQKLGYSVGDGKKLATVETTAKQQVRPLHRSQMPPEISIF